MKKYLVVAFMTVVLAGAIYGQEKPKEQPPALKPEVALELRNAQWESAKLAFQLQQLEVQCRALQAQGQEAGKKVSEKLATALERSGIDQKKYELNGDTLAVTPKPVEPEVKKLTTPEAKK